MQYRDLDVKQLANALRKQTDIIRRAGADTLANALTLRASAFEHALIPAEAETRYPVHHNAP